MKKIMLLFLLAGWSGWAFPVEVLNVTGTNMFVRSWEDGWQSYYGGTNGVPAQHTLGAGVTTFEYSTNGVIEFRLNSTYSWVSLPLVSPSLLGGSTVGFVVQFSKTMASPPALDYRICEYKLPWWYFCAGMGFMVPIIGFGLFSRMVKAGVGVQGEV